MYYLLTKSSNQKARILAFEKKEDLDRAFNFLLFQKGIKNVARKQFIKNGLYVDSNTKHIILTVIEAENG